MFVPLNSYAEIEYREMIVMTLSPKTAMNLAFIMIITVVPHTWVNHGDHFTIFNHRQIQILKFLSWCL